MQAVNSFSLARSGRALIVIGMHVAVVYLIAGSLGIVDMPTLQKPMEATIVEVPQKNEPMKPVAQPELVEPTLDVPLPDTIPIPEVEVPVEAVSEAALTAAPTDAVESTELAVSNRVAPAYPAISRRQGEEGVVTFRVLVDEKGNPLEVNVLSSSGHSRLDDAARQAIKKWKFVPPTRGGQAVRSWSRVQVRFQLETK
jgi:protein TonB